jgi:4-hydroxy-tetrahydrodipicolinate reductase
MTEVLRVIVSGVTGRMGRRLVNALQKQATIHIVAGITSPENTFLGKPLSAVSHNASHQAPILSNFSGLQADVVIDFSQSECFDQVVDYCVMNEVALVSGTTGLSQSQFDRISQAGHFIPVLWAANFSINIQIIKNLLQVFKQKNHNGEYRITETHHQHKQDAPSGTAIALAQSLSDSQHLMVVDHNRFTLGTIEITSVREAEVPGTHQIYCDFPNETITIEHVSKNGDLFAEGAVSAAKWLVQQDNGLYDLNAILLA